jgi:hypothetical protein
MTLKCEMKKLQLLPCSLDVCQECAVKHDPKEPHNAQSLYYHLKFSEQYNRAPTWRDAIAHCSVPLKQAWESELRKRNKWTE